MEHEEIRIIVREAVQETLRGLGIVDHDPLEMQADFVYVRRLRKGSEFVSQKIKASVIAAVVPAFLYVLWETLRNAIAKG